MVGRVAVWYNDCTKCNPKRCQTASPC
ncbi:MAG TPA: hypothetical protein IAB53_05790 [Candidatus Scybalocola faecipullorum]|nr:hypothetical protein [Candidatus Scybalocola faecipullorum]